MDDDSLVRPLSSDITPVFKFVLPVVVSLALVAVLVVTLAEGFGSFVLLGCVAAFVAFLLHEYLVPLKRVVAREHGLFISNYRTSISVPYPEIAFVARAYKRWDIVEIGLRSETPFGRSIMFMAGSRFVWGSEHPVVSFLRRRAGLPAEGGG